MCLPDDLYLCRNTQCEHTRDKRYWSQTVEEIHCTHTRRGCFFFTLQLFICGIICTYTCGQLSLTRPRVNLMHFYTWLLTCYMKSQIITQVDVVGVFFSDTLYNICLCGISLSRVLFQHDRPARRSDLKSTTQWPGEMFQRTFLQANFMLWQAVLIFWISWARKKHLLFLETLTFYFMLQIDITFTDIFCSKSRSRCMGGRIWLASRVRRRDLMLSVSFS